MPSTADFADCLTAYPQALESDKQRLAKLRRLFVTEQEKRGENVWTKQAVQLGARFHMRFGGRILLDSSGDPQIFEITKVGPTAFEYATVVFEDKAPAPFPPGLAIRYEMMDEYVAEFVEFGGGRLLQFEEWEMLMIKEDLNVAFQGS